MRIILSILVCVLALSVTVSAREIPVPHTVIVPDQCITPVLGGWHTAATMNVDTAARAVSIKTSDEFVTQVKRPLGMNDEEWVSMIQALDSDGFRSATAFVGITVNGEYYLAVSLAYETDEWKCVNLFGSRKFQPDNGLEIVRHEP